jgi:hypothetical protein
MRAPRRSDLLPSLFAALALSGAACETVELGEPPADINACRPSQQFFAAEIGPNFLFKDYGGKHCYDSTCHGALAPNALDLVLPDLSIPAAIPLVNEWAADYMTVTEEMNCSNVASSKLLTYPGGINVHGGGKLIEPDGPEATLIKMWISQP